MVQIFCSWVFLFVFVINFFLASISSIAQSAGAVEYTDFTSAEE